MQGNESVLFLALGILVDFVVVATVVSMTKDRYPRVAKWAKQIAAAPIVAMLLVGYFYGTPNAVEFGDRIIGFLPHLGIALWAMFVLHFALQTQANVKRIDLVATELDQFVNVASRILTGMPGDMVKLANASATGESLKAMIFAAQQRAELHQTLTEKMDMIERELEQTKAALDAHPGTTSEPTISSLTTFDPLSHRDEITRAVCVKRKISQTDLVELPFSYSTDFITFWPRRSDLDTWLVQELEEPIVTKNLQRQIEIISVSAEGADRKYVQKIEVIMMVYKSMSLDEKGSLLRQLEAVKTNGNLSPKITFKVWDKDDL